MKANFLILAIVLVITSFASVSCTGSEDEGSTTPVTTAPAGVKRTLSGEVNSPGSAPASGEAGTAQANAPGM